MKYRVPLKLTFDGFAIVEAVDETEAEQIACYHMGADLGHVTDGASDKIKDYDFEIHSNVELRDNESIEEFYSSIEDLLEDNGFNITEIDGGYELSQYTPKGEDWFITLNELIDIVEYAENFDPEEEFTMWNNARGNVAGVPSVGDLWQDQLWKQELLNKVANKIIQLEEYKLNQFVNLIME